MLGLHLVIAISVAIDILYLCMQMDYTLFVIRCLRSPCLNLNASRVVGLLCKK